ncbi:MAG TPA: hypothetical protein VIN10_08315 [Bacteroidales bacterium]
MKILFLVLCCVLLVATIQCQKDSFQKSPVVGTWIETTSNADTLEFLSEYDGTDPVFWLKRGKNDDSLPKEYSGPYSYKITESTISLRWFLSSYSGFHAYYFELSPNREIIMIGNFYNNPSENKDTLVFRKIE